MKTKAESRRGDAWKASTHMFFQKEARRPSPERNLSRHFTVLQPPILSGYSYSTIMPGSEINFSVSHPYPTLPGSPFSNMEVAA